MTKPGMLLTLLLVFITSATARATDRPPECDEGVYLTAYVTGLATGRSLVSQTWSGLEESCWEVDLLHDAVHDSIASYRPLLEGVSDVLARRVNCRFGGHVVGMTDRVDEIMDECGTYCCKRGRHMGGHFGHAYCMIAISAKGAHDPGDFIRPDVPYCGSLYEYCCTSASDEYASSWLECEEFVRYPHKTAYENYVEYTCAY
jgi:hypothetical protein